MLLLVFFFPRHAVDWSRAGGGGGIRARHLETEKVVLNRPFRLSTRGSRSTMVGPWRRLERDSRRALYLRLARRWSGTKAALKRAIREFLRPCRSDLGFLLKLAREARFAAIVAGGVLAGLTGPSHASSPIQLSSISAGIGGFVMNGEAADDLSGTSVSAAGDVNGDGLADLIVGAVAANPNGDDSGRSYVVFGKAGTAEVNLSAVAAGTGGFAINGEARGDRSGFSVSGAGDVNGDGLSDLIVGAAFANIGVVKSGRSYVVFGKPGTATVELSAIAAGIGGFAINGESVNESSGFSVSTAGDVNGDGLADLIVGAIGARPNGGYSGRSYVVFGKTGTAAVNLSAITAGVGGFVINGERISDFSGWSVSAAGDVNGDRFTAFLPHNPEGSQTYGWALC